MHRCLTAFVMGILLADCADACGSPNTILARPIVVSAGEEHAVPSASGSSDPEQPVERRYFGAYRGCLANPGGQGYFRADGALNSAVEAPR
jgi:hypothetical protein